MSSVDGLDTLRDQISYQQYLRLRKLKAQDRYLQELREIIWEDAAEILKNSGASHDDAVDQAVRMCELETGVDAYLEMKDVDVENR